jgi:hypothetical protein
MRYVVAGYSVVLVVLALYAVQLVWRRRRLAQAVDRVIGPPSNPVIVPPTSPATEGRP